MEEEDKQRHESLVGALALFAETHEHHIYCHSHLIPRLNRVPSSVAVFLHHLDHCGMQTVALRFRILELVVLVHLRTYLSNPSMLRKPKPVF